MSYIGIPPFGQTVRSVTTATATSGQTTFNISGGYVVGYVDVYLNGLLLAPTAYTATDGLTVVLGTGATAGDKFQALSYQPISFVDALKASNNLSEVASASTARTNLGLGSIATQSSSNVSISGGSITGITDLAVADGGTGTSSLTANNVILGNGTSAVQFVAPGANGNVLTSNGTTWVSQAAGGGGGATGVSGQRFTSNGTFTIPTGVTALKVTVVGAGGSGCRDSDYGGSGGGAGGAAIKYLTGLTPGNTLSVTIGTGGASRTTNSGGAAGGASSVSSGTQSITTIQGNGGSGGGSIAFGGTYSGGAGGAASGGDVNITGSGGAMQYFLSMGCYQVKLPGQGGPSLFPSVGQGFTPVASQTGSGGTGTISSASGAGGNGIVVFEW